MERNATRTHIQLKATQARARFAAPAALLLAVSLNHFVPGVA